MAKGKKYDYKITQSGTSWVAEIIRQVTSKKTVVSKSQDGFATEAEAALWGKNELASFLENQRAKNKRHSKS